MIEASLLNALNNIDWNQIALNGGPPCFFIKDSLFCLRAERWGGHNSYHKYVSLLDLIDACDALVRKQSMLPEDRLTRIEKNLEHATELLKQLIMTAADHEGRIYEIEYGIA